MKKFLQFQLSVNITVVTVTIIAALTSCDETPTISVVQLLWINPIMDTFAALTLATDPAHPVLLNHCPEHQPSPLFNVDMYKQNFGQSIYQISHCFYLSLHR